MRQYTLDLEISDVSEEKMQIPYLARHCRVVTFDGRGNGARTAPRAGTTRGTSPPTRLP
jgi:hypothetical protein